MDTDNVDVLKQEISNLREQFMSTEPIINALMEEQTGLQEQVQDLTVQLESTSKRLREERDFAMQTVFTTCCGKTVTECITSGIKLAACSNRHTVCRECVTFATIQEVKCQFPNCNCNLEKCKSFKEFGGDEYQSMLAKRAKVDFKKQLTNNFCTNNFVKRPCCDLPMPVNFEHCMAVNCNNCKTYFCGLCFDFIGNYDDTHDHVCNCKFNYQKNRSFFADTKHQKDVCQKIWMMYHIKKVMGDNTFNQSSLDKLDTPVEVLANTLQLLGLPTCKYGPVE